MEARASADELGCIRGTLLLFAMEGTAAAVVYAVYLLLHVVR